MNQLNLMEVLEQFQFTPLTCTTGFGTYVVFSGTNQLNQVITLLLERDNIWYNNDGTIHILDSDKIIITDAELAVIFES